MLATTFCVETMFLHHSRVHTIVPYELNEPERQTFYRKADIRGRRRSGIIIIIDRFYIALFSALEQTHFAHVACDSEGVTVSFYSALFIIHRSGVLAALLVPCETAAVSVHVLCKPYNYAPVYSVASFKAT